MTYGRSGKHRDGGCSVYLIARGQVTKVGISHDPAKRMADLQTSCPDRITLEHSWRLPSRAEACAMESAMHRVLKWAVQSGEWFNVPSFDVAHIGDALLAGDQARAEELSDIQRQFTTAENRRQKLYKVWRASNFRPEAERSAMSEELDRLDKETRALVRLMPRPFKTNADAFHAARKSSGRRAVTA